MTDDSIDLVFRFGGCLLFLYKVVKYEIAVFDAKGDIENLLNTLGDFEVEVELDGKYDKSYIEKPVESHYNKIGVECFMVICCVDLGVFRSNDIPGNPCGMAHFTTLFRFDWASYDIELFPVFHSEQIALFFIFVCVC